MTRTLGDMYLQYHGATWEPSVSCIDLHDLVQQLSQVTVVLASDGLWDVWAYKDVLKYPLLASAKVVNDGESDEMRVLETVARSLEELVEETRRESADLFGESADNLTALCVTFHVITPP